MTTRPGGQALALHTGHRNKRLCNVVRITRTDGVVMRWTDHDRRLTFEGAVYEPAVLVGSSAESREIALKSPEQKALGIIDGSEMLIPDLVGQRYRGAVVEQWVTDWKWPWLTLAKYYRTIRTIEWDGLRFVAMMEGVGQVLGRKSGGRFGGIMSIECPYPLAGTHCKADISAYQVIGARVGTVTDARADFEFTTASWPTQADHFYRYGEIRWLWGVPTETGTTTSINSATTLTDTAQSWADDELVGKTVRMLNAVGGYVQGYSEITGNDATTITYADENGNMDGWASGKDYDVVPDIDNLGVVSEIESYTDATRRVELYVPTPFDVNVGESGIVQAGCDGLFTTCDTKFGNHLNFGGNHLQPRPGDQWEVT